ncbi:MULTISPECIES: helix-turn-helix transcriptional regulator [Burkholderia]|uniref:helix-turn-helix transcriptional regulator n=1 Tax=Burkholderia TaxID=32008 RepID=UPI00050EBAD6|nr:MULTISPECIES: transcriptional regulator [Burkholderia]KGC39077.1 prophage CP4-57 regulatory family protein [Burkholderia pseudomallei]MCO1462061.1 transcriptional regulator [Burkholderia multivorans]
MTTTFHHSPPSGGHNNPHALPLDGYTRWADLKHLIPLCRESIRLRELAGRFPKRTQLGSSRSAAWPNRELHRWLADPDGYRAPSATEAA